MREVDTGKDVVIGVEDVLGRRMTARSRPLYSKYLLITKPDAQTNAPANRTGA